MLPNLSGDGDLVEGLGSLTHKKIRETGSAARLMRKDDKQHQFANRQGFHIVRLAIGILP